ncbi:hypothetical protein FRB96_009294 [Tulasnella sp. 330]|nr:hypothetical protein FRB96_009294 [Tulasnella sp. 330]
MPPSATTNSARDDGYMRHEKPPQFSPPTTSDEGYLSRKRPRSSDRASGARPPSRGDRDRIPGPSRDRDRDRDRSGDSHRRGRDPTPDSGYLGPGYSHGRRASDSFDMRESSRKREKERQHDISRSPASHRSSTPPRIRGASPPSGPRAGRNPKHRLPSASTSGLHIDTGLPSKLQSTVEPETPIAMESLSTANRSFAFPDPPRRAPESKIATGPTSVPMSARSSTTNLLYNTPIESTNPESSAVGAKFQPMAGSLADKELKNPFVGKAAFPFRQRSLSVATPLSATPPATTTQNQPHPNVYALSGSPSVIGPSSNAYAPSSSAVSTPTTAMPPPSGQTPNASRSSATFPSAADDRTMASMENMAALSPFAGPTAPFQGSQVPQPKFSLEAWKVKANLLADAVTARIQQQKLRQEAKNLFVLARGAGSLNLASLEKLRFANDKAITDVTHELSIYTDKLLGKSVASDEKLGAGSNVVSAARYQEKIAEIDATVNNLKRAQESLSDRLATLTIEMNRIEEERKKEVVSPHSTDNSAPVVIKPAGSNVPEDDAMDVDDVDVGTTPPAPDVDKEIKEARAAHWDLREMMEDLQNTVEDITERFQALATRSPPPFATPTPPPTAAKPTMSLSEIEAKLTEASQRSKDMDFEGLVSEASRVGTELLELKAISESRTTQLKDLAHAVEVLQAPVIVQETPADVTARDRADIIEQIKQDVIPILRRGAEKNNQILRDEQKRIMTELWTLTGPAREMMVALKGVTPLGE